LSEEGTIFAPCPAISHALLTSLLVVVVLHAQIAVPQIEEENERENKKVFVGCKKAFETVSFFVPEAFGVAKHKTVVGHKGSNK
jgi:hypothetical protein